MKGSGSEQHPIPLSSPLNSFSFSSSGIFLKSMNVCNWPRVVDVSHLPNLLSSQPKLCDRQDFPFGCQQVLRFGHPVFSGAPTSLFLNGEV